MFAEAWLWLAVVAGPLLFGAVEPWSLFLLQALLILLPLVCALALPKSGEPFIKAPFVPSLMVFLALGTLQLLSPRPLLGPQIGLITTVDPSRTVAALVLYACYGAFLISAPRVLARAGAVRRFAWMLFLLGAAIACVGLLQVAQGNTLIYGLRAVAPDRNPFGPYYNRDHAAALMTMALPIGAGLVYGRLSNWRRAGSFEAKANLSAQAALLAIPLGVLAAAFRFISSRGAMLGLAGSVALVFLWSLANTAAKKIVFASALLGAAVLLWGPVLDHVNSISASADPSVATRASMYKSGAELWKDSPLFGVGLGAFVSAFAPYRAASIDGMVDHLHNDWGEATLELGLVGLAALVAGFGWFLFNLGGHGKPSMDAESRALRTGALVAVVACVIHGFVEFALRIPGNAVYFLAASALASAIGRGQPPMSPRVSWRSALVPAMFVCVFAFLSAPRPGRMVSSEVSFLRAQLVLKQSEAEPFRRTELLRSALIHARAGLLNDSASPRGNRIMASILSGLGRNADARSHYQRASAG